MMQTLSETDKVEAHRLQHSNQLCQGFKTDAHCFQQTEKAIYCTVCKPSVMVIVVRAYL